MGIILGLWLLGVSAAVAVLIIGIHFRRFEHIATEVSAGILIAVFPFVFVSFADLPLLIAAALVHLWLMVLPARLLMGRLERPFLHKSTQNNALAGVAALTAVSALQLWRPQNLHEILLATWLTAGLGVGIFILGQLWWNRRRYHIAAPSEKLQLAQLPTVSVCIPARNEDHALNECLATVLASNYPKLEVLVLDDCSQDTTSTIIRSFAHDGVRFIQGDTPAAGWLGKNMAMDTLAQHASGEFLLFMDVDTHLSPQSITNAIYYALQNGQEMVSILPQNRLGATRSTLFNTLDYFWRQVLPIHKKYVPVSSKSWLITASALRHLGGFASVSRKIVPEESFASRLALSNSYRFIVSNNVLQITTAKRWTSQIESALRLLYPRLRRQPMLVLAVCAGLLGLFLAPFVALAACAVFGNFAAVWWLSVAACTAFLTGYAIVLRRTQPRSWFAAVIFWPFVVIQEFALCVTSMLQYEFGEVNWKGRNVCYPVLGSGQPRFVPPRQERR